MRGIKCWKIAKISEYQISEYQISEYQISEYQMPNDQKMYAKQLGQLFFFKTIITVLQWS